jgi:phosphopantothenoylcysteine synthetase/decarboxylase
LFYATFGIPLRDSHGNSYGMAAVDYYPIQWDALLRKFDLGRNGVVYVMERNGDLIASSVKNVQAYPVSLGIAAARTNVLAKDMVGEEMYYSGKYIIENGYTTQGKYEFNAENHQKYILTVQDYNLHGVDWVVVLCFGKCLIIVTKTNN